MSEEKKDLNKKEMTEEELNKVAGGASAYQGELIDVEATPYGLYEYKGRKTPFGEVLTTVGSCAVDRNLLRMYPYGTKIQITTSNGQVYTCRVNDIVSGKPRLSGSKYLIDILFETREECYAFGRQRVTVKAI